MKKEYVIGTLLIILLIIISLAILLGIGIGIKKYKIYAREMDGKAELKQAEWNRQIRIREAEAEREAAKALAQAEIERAHGVAEANKIIGDSLKGNEAYLRYLWIDGLQKEHNQVIYVPTEANLPILEAGRR